MAFEQITETPASQQQLDTYNRASSMIKRTTYSPPAGTHWAVLGLVVADAATTDDIPTLISGLEGLAGITSVASPQVWGQTPATLEINPEAPADPTHRLNLYCSGNLSANARGFAASKSFTFSARYNRVAALPDGKKWLLVNCVLPSAWADEAAYDAFVAAVQGVTGITTCKPLIWGTVPSGLAGVSLSIETRMRIDTIPVEE